MPFVLCCCNVWSSLVDDGAHTRNGWRTCGFASPHNCPERAGSLAEVLLPRPYWWPLLFNDIAALARVHPFPTSTHIGQLFLFLFFPFLFHCAYITLRVLALCLPERKRWLDKRKKKKRKKEKENRRHDRPLGWYHSSGSPPLSLPLKEAGALLVCQPTKGVTVLFLLARDMSARRMERHRSRISFFSRSFSLSCSVVRFCSSILRLVWAVDYVMARIKFWRMFQF